MPSSKVRSCVAGEGSVGRSVAACACVAAGTDSAVGEMLASGSPRCGLNTDHNTAISAMAAMMNAAGLTIVMRTPLMRLLRSRLLLRIDPMSPQDHVRAFLCEAGLLRRERRRGSRCRNGDARSAGLSLGQHPGLQDALSLGTMGIARLRRADVLGRREAREHIMGVAVRVDGHDG